MSSSRHGGAVSLFQVLIFEGSRLNIIKVSVLHFFFISIRLFSADSSPIPLTLHISRSLYLCRVGERTNDHQHQLLAGREKRGEKRMRRKKGKTSCVITES